MACSTSRLDCTTLLSVRYGTWLVSVQTGSKVESYVVDHGQFTSPCGIWASGHLVWSRLAVQQTPPINQSPSCTVQSSPICRQTADRRPQTRPHTPPRPTPSNSNLRASSSWIAPARCVSGIPPSLPNCGQRGLAASRDLPRVGIGILPPSNTFLLSLQRQWTSNLLAWPRTLIHVIIAWPTR